MARPGIQKAEGAAEAFPASPHRVTACQPFSRQGGPDASGPLPAAWSVRLPVCTHGAGERVTGGRIRPRFSMAMLSVPAIRRNRSRQPPAAEQGGLSAFGF
jgi:hypothetical protein